MNLNVLECIKTQYVIIVLMRKNLIEAIEIDVLEERISSALQVFYQRR